jgi:transposase
VIEATVAKGALVHTDEHARDDDGDGFREVHVNTAEGFWSLLRSWLRPHRGVSQEKLPAYLGFFEVVHNARARGKALLSALVGGLVAPASAHHPET